MARIPKKKKQSDPLKFIKDLIPKDLQKVIEERFVFSPDDIFKSVSIIGSAVLIKSGIEWSEEIFQKVPGKLLVSTFIKPNPIFKLLGITETIERRADQPDFDLPKREVMEWLLSLTMAYLIVTNFGDLVKAGASIVNMAKGLITGVGLK